MKSRLGFLATGFLLLSINTFAKTEFSKTIEYVQKTYADLSTKYPILIFDLDEIEFRYAKAKVFGDSKELEKKRQEIVKQYVREKTGLELTDNDAMTYEMYTTVLKEGAYAMPLLNDGPAFKKTYKMCAVFPATPNSNKRLETERITGLKTPGAYDDVTYEGLQKKLEYKEMQLFSLYHELGHCLDPYFMPENYNVYEVDAHSVHESESFAEVFALLILEREGVRGTGITRALLRNMYTQKMGKWFIDNPRNGFGNPMYLKGGIIYYLAPSLIAADEFVERNQAFLKGEISSLLDKAKEIVDANSLPSRSFHGIFRLMSEDKEKILQDYREWSVNDPRFFKETYIQMLHFLDFSPYLLSEIVGDTPNIDEGEDLESLDASEYCAIEDQAVLENYLQQKRIDLKKAGASYETQQVLQTELNSFFESYAKCQ